MASCTPRPVLSWPLRLLLLCLTVQRGSAISDQPAADPAAGEACLASTLDLLWSSVGRIVRSVVKPEVSELDGRLAGLQTQLTDLVVVLDRLHQAQNVTLQRHLEDIETSLERTHSELGSKLAGVQSEIHTRLENVQSQLKSELEGVQSDTGARLDNVYSQLEARLVEVSSNRAPPRDCSDLPAGSQSGVHLLQPGLRQPVPSYCDQETDVGGWTVFQRRADIQPRQDFFLGWEDYRQGFGTLDAEFWWGLEHLFHTTSLLDRRYELRIDMEDFDGEKRFALYQDFRISSEADGYRLHAANYSGTAGGDNLGSVSGVQFSTKDRDHDTYKDSCAAMYKGGWWYTACHTSNLNGLYLSGSHTSYADGINWHAWRGHHYSLKNVEMKIRPSKKL